MIITGDLTLPDGVSAQRFLSEMFDLGGYDQSPLFQLDFETISETRLAVTDSNFGTLLYDTIDRAELVFTSTNAAGLFDGDRLITMIVLVGTDGKQMNITLIEPTSYDEFNAALASGGVEAFNNLLMPQTGPGFFLDQTGSSGGDTMEGFGTGDFLNGAAGNDYIMGFDGNDAIRGGSGDDTLSGGTGDDTLDGGAGRDVFDIGPNQNRITIDGLQLGEDVFNLKDFGRDKVLEALLDSDKGFVIDGTEVVIINSDLEITRVPLSLVNLADLEGSDQGEALTGSGASEAIRGMGGDDTITGGEGSDTIDGGAGEDTAVYGGNQSNYTLFIDPMGIEIQDRLSPEEYKDLLDSVEFLDFETDLELFSDTLFDLRLFSGAADLEVDELAQIIELYIAYLDRAPDAIGLLFWATAFENGATLEELAAYFVDQPEIRDRFPDTLSNEEFVRQVYDQALGREPDEDGAGFWKGMLDDELVGRDEFILYVLGGAKAAPAEGASQAFVDQQAADRAFLGHKTDIGAEFGIKKGMSDVGNAISAMELFDGTQSSLDTALAAINEYYVEALDPESGEFLIQLTGMSAVDFTE